MIKDVLLAIPALLALHSVALANVPSCAALAEDAAAAHDIPVNLLPAISTVETQRGGRPWPWTLNEGGKSHYFETKDEALDYLTDAVARGVTNIDVGCMQLNFRWHAAGFSSLDAMLDPRKNTNYAALFLVELKTRLGNWEEATKHYHSSDEARGNAYRDKVVAAAKRRSSVTDGISRDEPSPENVVRASANDRGPLIVVGDAGLVVLNKVAQKVHVAEPVVGFSDNSDILHGQKQLPPRLGRRWEELQRVREALAAGR